MFLLIGACPQCGAPLFANIQPNPDAGYIVDIEQGLWDTLPTPHYTCECRMRTVGDVRLKTHRSSTKSAEQRGDKDG